MQHTISEQAFHFVGQKLATLQARAQKLGCPILVTVAKIEDRPRQDGGIVRYVTLDVQGSAPKLAGWGLVAELENVDGKALVRTVPGNELPARFQAADPTLCEHCNTRRFRSHTYVLRHEDGRLAQVGSACIRDFLGHQDPQSLIGYAEVELEIARELAEVGEYFEHRAGGPVERWSIATILALTACAIRGHGWVSKANSSYYKTATAVRVEETLTHVTKAEDELHPGAEDRALGQVALDWARNYFLAKGEATLSDYEHNIKLLVSAESESAKIKHLGFLCSIIPWYQREQAKAQEVATPAAKPSSFVGTIGERRSFTVMVERVLDRASDFGITHIHKLIDGEGNEYTWFASSECLNQGQTYTLKATVKAHDEYKGKKQTTITRAKVA